MDISNILQDNTCYVVSDELKHYLLEYMKQHKLLLNVHFFSLNNFLKKAYFTYDNKAIYMVGNRFNVSYSNAKMLIDNLF